MNGEDIQLQSQTLNTNYFVLCSEICFDIAYAQNLDHFRHKQLQLITLPM